MAGPVLATQTPPGGTACPSWSQELGDCLESLALNRDPQPTTGMGQLIGGFPQSVMLTSQGDL